MRNSQREREPWPPRLPPRGAIQVQRWNVEDDDRPTSILVRHPTAPFVQDVDLGDEPALQAAAHRYLSDVQRVAGRLLPKWWLAALDPARGRNPDFGWLPTVPPREVVGRPINSFFARNEPKQGQPSLSLILLASERSGAFVLGSEFGLRVVVHARPFEGRRHKIRITGLTASLPFGDYDSSGRIEDFWTSPGEPGFVRDLLSEALASAAGKLGLDPNSVFFRGFRLGRRGDEFRRLELRGRGLSTARTSPPDPYEFIATFRVGTDRSRLETVSVTKTPLIACMSGTARIFQCDPASQDAPAGYRKRRPTRPEEALDAWRVPVEPVPVPLDDGHDLLRVVPTRFVLGDNPAPGAAKNVPLPNPGPPLPLPPVPFPPVRSNNASAVSAYANLWQIFERFTLYGINPQLYFNLAALPVEGHYRSGVRPGPGKDGQTVNVRVLPEGWDVNDIVRPPGADRPILQVHLALADLSTRARLPWDGQNRSPAEPLGIAADLRWMWHEAAHVLMVATLGELEFRFAHSTGDALAAIVADPCSRLGDDPASRHWRFYTFPWVFIPRRHDRCVLHGWGWRGALGRDVRRLPDGDRLRRKGYWTEQILSTSLFRVYLCLGGDTVGAGTTEPDRGARKRASDYTVFLIMEALRLLGDQLAVPAARANLFAAAVADADERAETCPTEDGQGNIALRTGGCAWKVIAWAFAAQGMDDGGPDAISNEPAPPPPVDIYVRDRRPENEAMPAAMVPHGPGTYVPVSLDWGVAGAPPLWFAHADAITQEADGAITVRVANRGTAVAQAVDVTVRWRRWPAGQPTPSAWDVNDIQWLSVGPSLAQDIAPGATAVFGPFARPAALPAERCIVLAQADCADDLSNLDPGPDLACLRHPTRLNELVPFDNNLGLAVMPAP